MLTTCSQLKLKLTGRPGYVTKPLNETAYGLGKRGYKAGESGEAFSDKLFSEYVMRNNVPVVQAVGSYIDGYQAAKIKAESVVIDATDRFKRKE